MADDRATSQTAGALEERPAPPIATTVPQPAGLSSRLRERLRAELADGLGEALWLFVTLRVALSLFALMVAMQLNLSGPSCTWDDWEISSALRGSLWEYRLVGVWQRWDACWYERVAGLGYRPGEGQVAFYPLYPLLMYLVGLPLDRDFALSGLIVSGLSYIAAMTGLYRLVNIDFDEETAWRTILYLSVFPTAFFLFAPFTESLFLALSVWSIYLARRGAWMATGVVGFLAGLARLQGCLLALALAWEAIRQWRAGRGQLGLVYVGALPIGGIVTFLLYGATVSGRISMDVQRQAWGRHPEPPWTVIAASWGHIGERGDIFEALNLATLLLAFALLLYGAYRLPFSYTVWAAPQVGLVVSQVAFFSPLMSVSRYLLVVFPIFVALALLGRHRCIHYSWMILSILLLGLFLYAFLSGPFVA